MVGSLTNGELAGIVYGSLTALVVWAGWLVIRFLRLPEQAPMTTEELTAWLLEHHAAEEQRGYGYIAAEDLAELLLENFEMEPKEC